MSRIEPKQPCNNLGETVEPDASKNEETGTAVRRSNKGLCISDPDYIFPPFALSTVYGPDEWSDFIDTLQAIYDACDDSPNNVERAKVMISFCIDKNVRMITHIIGVLEHFGFKPVDIAVLLKELSGHERQHWWMYAGDGSYLNLR